MSTLNWKDRTGVSGNICFSQARASREIGGKYVISRHVHFWNVDHRRQRGRMRRQLGFAYTAEDAKDLAQADYDKIKL